MPISSSLLTGFGATGVRNLNHAFAPAVVGRLPGVGTMSANRIVLNQPDTVLSGVDVTGQQISVRAPRCKILAPEWDHRFGVFPANYPIYLEDGADDCEIAYCTYRGMRRVDDCAALIGQKPGVIINGLRVHHNNVEGLSRDFMKLGQLRGAHIHDNFVHNWRVFGVGDRPFSVGMEVRDGDFVWRGQAVWRVLIDGVTTGDIADDLGPPPQGKPGDPGVRDPQPGWRYVTDLPHIDVWQQSPLPGATTVIEDNHIRMSTQAGHPSEGFNSIWFTENSGGPVDFLNNLFEGIDTVEWPWSHTRPGAYAGTALSVIARIQGNAMPAARSNSSAYIRADGVDAAAAISKTEWGGNVAWDTGTAIPAPSGTIAI